MAQTVADGDAVLAGAGLGDDAGLAHAARKQHLAEAIVDLVGAGVIELVALEVDLGTAEVLGEAGREIERRGAAGVVLQEVLELGVEFGIGLGGGVGFLEFEDRGHQRFGHEAAAENAEVAALVGAGAEGVRFRLIGHSGLRLIPRSH